MSANARLDLPLDVDEATAKEVVEKNTGKEKFLFLREFKWNEEIKSFHQLKFNDSISIRLVHESYLYSLFNKSQCVIMFKFLDKENSEITRFTIIPGAAEFKFVCMNLEREAATFPDNSYKKSYNFTLVFSSIGILMFFDDYYYFKSVSCINRITDITSVQLFVHGTKGFEAELELIKEQARVPDNWHIVNNISMLHTFIIYYARQDATVITVRLADGNGITAIAVTVDYKTGILYTKRDRLDDEKIQCVNFGSTEQFANITLDKVEISIFPYQYKVRMTSASDKFSASTPECIIYGHHLYPYDIRQAIFDSTSKKTVAYAYQIKKYTFLKP